MKRNHFSTVLVLSVLMLFVMIPTTVFGLDTEENRTITLGNFETVENVQTGKWVTFEFIPEESGKYIFETVNDNGLFIIYGEIYEYNESTGATNLVTSDVGPRFRSYFQAEAGRKYRLQVQANEDNVEYKVRVRRNTVLSIEFQPVNNYEYFEGDTKSGQYENEGTADEWFNYLFPGYFEGDKLIVTTSEGTINYTFRYFNKEPWSAFINDADQNDILKAGEDVSVDDNQRIDHWEIGVNEGYIFSYLNASCKVPVTVKKNPIGSIRFVPSKEYTFVERKDGRIQNEGTEDEYYLYDIQRNEGDKLFIMTDEGEKEYEYRYLEDGGYYVNKDGDKIKENDVSFNPYSDQSTKHWEVGTNYFTVSYLGKKSSIPVTIIKNSVSSIEFIPVNPYSFMEYDLTHGNIKNKGTENEYFHYSFPGFETGDKLIVHTDNGDIHYTFNRALQSDPWMAFVNDDDQNDMLLYQNNVSVSDGNQDNEAWKIGENEGFTITYYGVSCKVPVTITESSVKSIRYIPANEYTFYEFSHGRRDCAENGESFFHYEIYKEFGDKLVVVTDEGEKVYEYQYLWGDGGYYISVDDEKIPEKEVCLEFSDQYSEPWGLGEHYGQASYQGKSYSLTVTIKDCPVTAIDYIPVKPYEIIEETHGSIQIDNEGHEFFVYDLPYLNIGDKLILKTNEGDLTYEFKVVENYGDAFVNTEDENDLLNSKFNFMYYEDQIDTHWNIGSENYFTIDVNEKTCKVPVTILKNPVNFIEYTPIHMFKFKEGDETFHCGVFTDSDGNEYFHYIAGFQLGDVLTIYTDDGPKEYLYRHLHNNLGTGFANITDMDDVIKPDSEIIIMDDQRQNHWGPGEHFFTVNYLGRSCDFRAVVVSSEEWGDEDQKEREEYYERSNALYSAYEAINQYEVMDPDNYTANTFKPYKEAAETLIKLLENRDSDIVDIVTAVDMIQHARLGLVSKSSEELKAEDEAKKPAVIKKAKAAIKEAEKYKKADYTSWSYYEFKERLNDLKRIVKKDYVNLTSAQIENAITQLKEAEGYLVKYKTNPMTAKVTKKVFSVKYSMLKKNDQVIEKDTAFDIKDPVGDVTFNMSKRSKEAGKKIRISKAGLITVKKGLKKGTYDFSVKITASGRHFSDEYEEYGDDYYKAGSKTVTVRVKVK